MKNFYLVIVATLVVSSFVWRPAHSKATPYPASIFTIDLVYADSVAPAPTPSPSPSPSLGEKIPGEVKKAADGLDVLLNFLGGKEGFILMVLGVLMTLAKRVSTEKAVPVIKIIQAMFDALSYAMIKLGALLKYLAEILAKLLASDGVGGKQ